MITYNREALSLCPPIHPERPTSLNNIAIAVHARYKQSNRMEDLEEVITYYREALTLWATGHPNCSTSLNNLADAVLGRYRKLGRM